MFRAFSITLICLLTFTAVAQKKTKEHTVKGAIGVAVGGKTNTMAQVIEMAKNKAKVNALQKAGIEEHINSYSDYFRSESNDKMEELFTSDVLSNIRGNVKDIVVIDTKEELTPEKQFKATVTINCTVIEYITTKDLEFDVWVEGFKPIYKEGDGLEFEIKPTLDCYMKAFLFTEIEDFAFFPNQVENTRLFSKMQAYKFPIEAASYELDAGGIERQMNRAILVFTKKNIPYTGIIAYKNITEWIMNIPPDERVIKSFSFDVYKDF